MSRQLKKHCDAVRLQKSYAAERKVLSTINGAHMPARWRAKRRIKGKRQGSPWMCHVAYGLNYILIVDCDGVGNHRLAGLCICQLGGDRHYEPAVPGIRKRTHCNE